MQISTFGVAYLKNVKATLLEISTMVFQCAQQQIVEISCLEQIAKFFISVNTENVPKHQQIRNANW